MAPRSTSRSTKPQAATSIRRSTKPQAAASIGPSTDPSDVVVGIVRGPHGVRGEVRIQPLTDRFAQRFGVGARLESAAGPLIVASVRGTGDEPIVAFEGIADRDAAERLRGELRISRTEARTGVGHLWADLVGMRVVTPDGAPLGEVSEVLRAGGADVLVVRDGSREVLLPAIDTVVREIDPRERRIVAVPQEEA